VIVERNAWTMPQERYNTVWVQEQQIGIVLRSFRSIRRAVAEMVAQLDAYRARVRLLETRGVRNPRHPRRHPGAGARAGARAGASGHRRRGACRKNVRNILV